MAAPLYCATRNTNAKLKKSDQRPTLLGNLQLISNGRRDCSTTTDVSPSAKRMTEKRMEKVRSSRSLHKPKLKAIKKVGDYVRSSRQQQNPVNTLSNEFTVLNCSLSTRAFFEDLPPALIPYLSFPSQQLGELIGKGSSSQVFKVLILSRHSVLI